MLLMKYIGLKTEYEIEFSNLTKNIVQVKGDVPAKTHGFTLSRPGMEDNWDYSAFTTVYRELDGVIQFSNDGSIYVPPAPTPAPDPEPYVPTLEELKDLKVQEMGIAKQSAVAEGFDATLSDGTTEHFDLSDEDMLYLTGLQTQVLAGVDPIPWHVSDDSIPCKNYSNQDMGIITSTAMFKVTFHVTYLKDITRYINSIETETELNEVYYGMDIPEEFQSDPLKGMLAQRG